MYNVATSSYMSSTCRVTCRSKVLSELHEGHMVTAKTKSLARSYVWWPGTDEAVESTRRACVVCASDADAPSAQAPQYWPWFERRWLRHHVNFFRPIADISYLVAVDACSKWIQAIRAKTITSSFSIDAIAVAGLSDEGPGGKVRDTPPPIELKSFNSQVELWPSFYECFKINVHDNEGLSDSQKLHYLLGKLSGPALKLTAGIVPAGENYASIWQSLVNKYQDKRALGSHYMSILMNIKPAINNAASLDTFIESFSAAVSALEQLKITDLKDFMLLTIALRKIDSVTAQAFEMAIRDKEIPSYSEFVEFIKGQVKILDRTSNRPTVIPTVASPRHNNTVHYSKTLLSRDNIESCSMCNNGDHLQLYQCTTFKSLPVEQRFEFIKNKRACINCLSMSHTVSRCNSSHYCKMCNKQHHTLLHKTSLSNKLNNRKQPFTPPSCSHALLAAPSVSTAEVPAHTLCNCPAHPPLAVTPPIAQLPPPTQLTPCVNNQVSLCARAHVINNNNTILLSTAQINVLNDCKQKLNVRCLIDNASQNHIVTTACCKRLNLKPIPLNVHTSIKGIGSASQTVRGWVPLCVSSKNNLYNYTIDALVVDVITENMPSVMIDATIISSLLNIPLADPLWHTPGQIELVLGAQLFPYLLLGGKIIAPPAPAAIETVFGYILIGEVASTADSDTAPASSTFLICSEQETQNDNLDKTLCKFWELEEVPSKRFMSPEETECEQIYCDTISRDSTGKYCTSLPFSKDPSILGDSRSVATRRLLSLERKLKDPVLRASYNEIIQEYLINDYLSEVLPTSNEYGKGYYIPHHPVIRNDKETTKLRIVLDASAKCHNDISLNDILHTGPNLQADILILLLNFRLFPIALTADIKQMYLRIEVRKEHRKYQKILYRFNSTEPIREFQFNRVAFGLRCSPYLAMRTVRQLAEDERTGYPRAADVATNELYMDDLATSVSTFKEGVVLSRELIALFKEGGFHLTKWASNSVDLLSAVPESNRTAINFSNNDSIKILGLKWLPSEDVFTFSTCSIDEKCTKRTILSAIARLWDVLGFAAPVILFAKLLIQELWIQHIGWDDAPPMDIQTNFHNFIQQLKHLSSLKIPRHVNVEVGCTTNIVAFSDASMKAYGCVVYLHVTDPIGKVHVALVCAKSKVAPTKTVTLARLELCAAVLMSKLVKLVLDTYNSRININKIFAFSDSQIALSWIHSSPHRWNVFVSNRVAKCQENLASSHFYYVNTTDNPSDCLSRGLLPDQLISHPLWWHGPVWLQRPLAEWPISPFKPVNSRSVIKQRVHSCNKCFKASPSSKAPKMADLPPYRVRETKAFVHTGVDYAGPIKITLRRHRGQKSQKAYICLFICLVTKAVHIELATDLSSDIFISAFKRFISRRGPVSCLYSDNGTNFVGAKAQLHDLMLNNRIEWHMIPPRAPHFGGLGNQIFEV
ncbi:uncharacterized protein LOC128200074 [Galleria mellonella]|uniref:Uncharacterized protein LOC128200074 n=1 Tax=Galleria mellonella TaxID=7137 RepID=A0ABM3M9R3_GALME|nr:uncharacterized protein LOC128200074 [Galleria mellonella]